MPIAQLKCVREVSSEDPVHEAANLLSTDLSKKWKTKSTGDKSAYVILEFEEPYEITGIDIGNEHSAFVEVLVGKAGNSEDDFTEILITCSFMTPIESKNSTNVNRVRCFGRNALVESKLTTKWKVIKVFCTQPFNKHVQFGLSFIKVHVSEITTKNNHGVKALVPENLKRRSSNQNQSEDAKKTKFGLDKFSLREYSSDSDSESVASLFSRWKMNRPKNGDGSLSIASAIQEASIPDSLRRMSDKALKTECEINTPCTSSQREHCSTKQLDIPDNNRNGAKQSAQLPKKNKGTQMLNQQITDFKMKKTIKEFECNNTMQKIEKLNSTSAGKIGNNIKLRPFKKLLDGVVLVISGIQESSSELIRIKVLSGDYKVKPYLGRSKVWDIFGRIETNLGVEIPDFVICRKCIKIYKFNKKSTSNLVKHKCYMNADSGNNVVHKICADNNTKKVSVDLFTKWVVINCRPYRIAGDSGLKEIAEFFVSIGCKYGPSADIMTFIPNPTTISRNVESLYKTSFDKIKSEILTINDVGYGLTSDLWTDNFLRKSYLALTIHFVKNGNIYCRLLGMMGMDNERNTSENIHQKVVNLLSEFECTLSDKAIMVTDRGSNMISAFRSYQHLFCINHLLQNTLKKSMDEVNEISNFCNLGSKIVRYFKKSGDNSSLTTTLKSYSPTRWNTFYYLFLSIKINWNEITQILQEKNELHRLGELNVAHIICLIDILELFEEALKKLEGEKYPTLHLVIVHIDKLLRKCAVRDEDILMIKLFKQKILHYLKSLVLENLNIFHKIALFLFPPANKLIQFENEEKEAIRRRTKEIMTEFSANQPLPLTNAVVTTNSDLFGRYVYQFSQSSSVDMVSDEIMMYENTIIHYTDDFDALKWWDSNKNQFPLLFKTSCRILAIPASSASSERVFSAARNLLTEKRCAMGCNSESVNQIMFLHHNNLF